ncbi:MAG: tetratricopeptide (TPR) repeat protein [Planctomycetota bacterium]|jgi:tetratricopeptide (TPR) repeat protein
MSPESHNNPFSKSSPGMEAQAEFDAWDQQLNASQMTLQADLSCLADGELDEAAAARVMVKLEEDDESREFFDDIQRFARLHRDMAEPERVMARLASLTGDQIMERTEEIDLVSRLATIFYQLGKAYVISAIEPKAFRERVFETTVPIESTRTRGRGFVDGVLLGGRADKQRLDWREARTYLNGRLERVEDPLKKGLHLLQQAIATDASHEEARIYLAFVYAQQGKRLKAAKVYREVFDTAISQENRGHAAVQIGQLHTAEDEHRQAAIYYRWVCTSGLAEQDARFWFVDFNLAMAYLGMGNPGRCLDYLSGLSSKHPDRIQEAAKLAVSAELFQEAMQGQAGFAERFAERCPEYLTSGGA